MKKTQKLMNGKTLHLITNNIFVNPFNLRIQMYNYLNLSSCPF